MKVVPGLFLLLAFAMPAAGQKKEDDRLKESHDVLKEILGTPDNGIPRDLLNKA